MTRHTVEMISEARQDGGCNGQGGKVRKVAVAWVVQGARRVRYFGSRPGDQQKALAWAEVLNERYGL